MIGTFLISLIISLQILATKFIFLLNEGGAFSKFNLIVNLFIIILAIAFFFFRPKMKKVQEILPKNWFLLGFFAILILITISASFYINIGKTALDWDAVALFEARAKYLSAGMKISEMMKLTEFDQLSNKPYYLLYPPHTTLVHYFWGKVGLNYPVSVYYALVLLFLGISVFSVSYQKLGVVSGLFLALITISNKDIFVLSTLEYANLPYTLSIVFGVFLIALFLYKRDYWILLFGTFLIGTSQWIRWLEPIWLITLVSFAISYFAAKNVSRRRKLLVVLLITAFFFLEYLYWGNFSKNIAGSPGLVKINTLYIVKPILGIITGNLSQMFTFLARNWGLYLIIYLTCMIVGIMNFRMLLRNVDLLFIFMFIFLTLCFYIFGIYFMSFQKESWEVLGGSLLRSSTFLVPISGYLLLRFAKK